MQGEEKKAIKFQHTFLMKVEKKRESFLFFFFSIWIKAQTKAESLVTINMEIEGR